MYQIRFRANRGYGPDLTFAQAAQAAAGDNDRGYWHGEYISVVAVYAERTVEPAAYQVIEKVHEAGEPVWGLEVTVNPRDERYAALAPAQVNWSALGTQDTATAQLFAELITLAAQIADAANAAPVPADVAAELARR